MQKDKAAIWKTWLWKANEPKRKKKKKVLNEYRLRDPLDNIKQTFT